MSQEGSVRLSNRVNTQVPAVHDMNALSRREEDTLLKTTKARALKECDPVVKGLYFCYRPQLLH